MVNIYPFQKIGAKEIADKKRFMLADSPGMFKTSQAILAKNLVEAHPDYPQKKLKTLFVCPNSVKEHIVDEIELWYHGRDDAKVVIINSQTADNDLKNARDASFTIISYELLSYWSSSNGYLEKLKKLGFNHVIADEVHNVKNPQALRTKAVKEIADSAEYVTLLSGTPAPNGILDLYMILSYMEPQKFKVDFENPIIDLKRFWHMYRRNPLVVKSILGQRMLRRENDLLEGLEGKFPDINRETIDVQLNKDSATIYRNIYDNDELRPTTKLTALQYATLDPNLVDPEILDPEVRELIGKIEPPKYKTLDEIVEKETKKPNGKVLIFSYMFKNGITEKLAQRYAKYGAVVIDGDCSATARNGASERENIRLKFQNNPNTKVLICTTVMNEGVDVTAATAIVNLDKPYTPAEVEQAIRRSARRGEVKKDSVKVYDLVAKLPNKYDVDTIDEGKDRLLQDKDEIIKDILRGIAITKEQFAEITAPPSKTKPIKDSLDSPKKKLAEHFGHYIGQGFKKINSYLEKCGSNKKLAQAAESIARAYKYCLKDFTEKGSGWTPGNTAKIYTQIINSLQKVENLEKKLDLASGPSVLSFLGNFKTTSLDIDAHMLKTGRELVGKNSTYVQGFLHQMPFSDGSFDLAVMSEAYQHTSPLVKHGEIYEVKEGIKFHTGQLYNKRNIYKTEKGGKLKSEKGEVREREQAIREANRVLRKGGYLILTMPEGYVNNSDTQKFYSALDKLGFSVVDELSGYIRSANKDSDFRAYVMTARKSGNPQEEELSHEYFTFAKDRRQKTGREYKLLKKKLATNEGYVFEHNGRTLDASIQNYLKRL